MHTDISLGEPDTLPFERVELKSNGFEAVEPFFDVQLPEADLIPFEVSDDQVVEMPVTTFRTRPFKVMGEKKPSPFNFLLLFLIFLGVA